MKKLMHIALIGLWLIAAQAYAKDEKVPSDQPHKAGKQQEKMKKCHAEAKGLKGDERKAKMSACLKG
jgi:hypothetical protein